MYQARSRDAQRRSKVLLKELKGDHDRSSVARQRLSPNLQNENYLVSGQEFLVAELYRGESSRGNLHLVVTGCFERHF